MNLRKITSLTLLAALALLLASCSNTTNSPSSDNSLTGATIAIASLEGTEATVYKDPSCSCCKKYTPYLEAEDMKVNIVETNNIADIKKQHNIPGAMQSCHTTIIGEYFVEGHVPVEAVQKLLSEKPDIDGIAMPGMPSGSPGMPGAKKAPFEVYAIKDGKVVGLFTTV